MFKVSFFQNHEINGLMAFLFLLIIVLSADIQEKVADAVNNIVKYFYKDSDVSIVFLLDKFLIHWRSQFTSN